MCAQRVVCQQLQNILNINTTIAYGYHIRWEMLNALHALPSLSILRPLCVCLLLAAITDDLPAPVPFNTPAPGDARVDDGEGDRDAGGTPAPHTDGAVMVTAGPTATPTAAPSTAEDGDGQGGENGAFHVSGGNWAAAGAVSVLVALSL